MIWRGIPYLVFLLLTLDVSAQERSGRDVVVTIQYDRGDLRVTGSDKDQIEAVLVDRISGRRSMMTIRQEADRTIIADLNPSPNPRRPVDLEVRLPSRARLTPIFDPANRIEVLGMQSPLDLRTESGDIRIENMLSGKIVTTSGNISVAGVSTASINTGSGNIFLSNKERTVPAGAVEIVTTNGNVRVDSLGSDIHLLSVSSKVRLECARGDIEVRDSNSQIDIVQPGGNLVLSSPNGNVYLVAPARFAKTYRLKTLAGRIQIYVPESTGFSYKIASYKGRVEDEFAGRYERAGATITGKYGDGNGSIDIDAVEGTISLQKRPLAGPSRCGQR